MYTCMHIHNIYMYTCIHIYTYVIYTCIQYMACTTENTNYIWP